MFTLRKINYNLKQWKSVLKWKTIFLSITCRECLLRSSFCRFHSIHWTSLSGAPLCNTFPLATMSGWKIMIYFFINASSITLWRSFSWLWVVAEICKRSKRARCCWWGGCEKLFIDVVFNEHYAMCHPISEFEWCLNESGTQVTLFINKDFGGVELKLARCFGAKVSSFSKRQVMSQGSRYTCRQRIVCSITSLPLNSVIKIPQFLFTKSRTETF